MPLSAFPKVNSTKALVPGHFTLILSAKLRYTNAMLRCALTSVKSSMNFPSAGSVISVDIEPIGAQQAALFYKWHDTAYQDLAPKLTVPREFPIQGHILLSGEASCKALESMFEVEAYTLNSVGPGPLALDLSAE